MYHRALKFSRHPSIPSKAIVNEAGAPIASSNKRSSEDEGSDQFLKAKAWLGGPRWLLNTNFMLHLRSRMIISKIIKILTISMHGRNDTGSLN